MDAHSLSHLNKSRLSIYYLHMIAACDMLVIVLCF